jgi:beta-1,4-mannosyltransferase
MSEAHSETKSPVVLGGRVAFFPSAEYLANNPYWPLLKSALEELGAEVVPSTPLTFGRRWLVSHRGDVRVLHIHFVQPFYAYESVHARLRWVVRFARSLALARLFGYRTVFTLHDLRSPRPLQPAWVDYLGYWVAANCTDRVIVHCAAARSALRSHYGRRRGVHVVEHPGYVGVLPNRIDRDTARARFGLQPHQRVFLFFGALRRTKGVDDLIAAFTALGDADVRLLIAGAPDPPSELQYWQARCAHDARIHLEPRYIADDEVEWFMNAADAVVFPFAEILTSGSVHLAMSFARPVIAPARGCLPELLAPDAGLLYDPNVPEGLRSALQHCLTADVATLGRAAFERVRTRTWRAAAEQTLAIYAGTAD